MNPIEKIILPHDWAAIVITDKGYSFSQYTPNLIYNEMLPRHNHLYIHITGQSMNIYPINVFSNDENNPIFLDQGQFRDFQGNQWKPLLLPPSLRHKNSDYGCFMSPYGLVEYLFNKKELHNINLFTQLTIDQMYYLYKSLDMYFHGMNRHINIPILMSDPEIFCNHKQIILNHSDNERKWVVISVDGKLIPIDLHNHHYQSITSYKRKQFHQVLLRVPISPNHDKMFKDELLHFLNIYADLDDNNNLFCIIRQKEFDSLYHQAETIANFINH